MINTLDFIKNNKINSLVWLIWWILFLIIILNSFFPEKIEFHNYHIILVHITIFSLIYKIWIYILTVNENNIKIALLDSRLYFLIAIILFIHTPFYLILEKKEIAENLSIYAYHLLILWVIYEIILSKFDNKIQSIKNSIKSSNIIKERNKERKQKLSWKRKKKR